MEKSYLRLLLGRLLILIEVEMATLVEVDSVERPEGVVMVGMEKMDQVEREKVHLELVDKQRRAESHTQCREDRASQA